MAELTRINSPGGAAFTVAQPHAERFSGLLNDLEAAGYKINGNQSGGYNYRTIAGTNKLSNHAHGAAIDVNWTDNARGTPGNIPPDLARALAQKHGLTWGGDWRNPDPMHFEVPGQPGHTYGDGHNHGAAPTQQSTPTGAPAMAAPALTPYDGPSPDDVAMQRKLAMSLMQQGTSTEPVGHWTQALARVLQGGVGGMYQDTARQGEKQGTQGIVDMLQGQQNPTPVQLLSNPWTREAGMKTLVQAAKGPEYGKQGTIVQDGQGNFYAVQFNDKGETKYHKLQAGGQSPTGVMSSESGMQMNGGQGVAPTALQPSKGTKQIGSTVVDVATGKPISNVEEAIAGKEKAEEVGKVQGKFVGAFPKLEASLQAWDRQAELTSKIIDRSIQSIEKNGRYVAGIGAPLAMLPETDARRLRNDLETIKANIGFDKLQAMREASPTGGALGAVSDMENRLLQAVQGALDQAGDPKALSDNLVSIKQMLGALRLEKKQAFATDVSRFGGAARPQGAPPGAGIPAPVTPRLKFNPATGVLE